MRIAHVACPPEQLQVGRKVAGDEYLGKIMQNYYFLEIMQLCSAGACSFRCLCPRESELPWLGQAQTRVYWLLLLCPL